MHIIKAVGKMQDLSSGIRAKGHRIGFVPTMGALHDGHLALLRRCRRDNEVCVLSIFVNPLQFGPNEDYRAYPRRQKQDVSLAKKENVDIIFCPSAGAMYPTASLTSIHVRRLSELLCGRFRPGHFEGVATVVAKLLNAVNPHVLYLGQKDAQQCCVIRQMIQDLNFSVNVKTVATVREKDGLAMSSRNSYLSPAERKKAAFLFRALKAARREIRSGERRADKIIKLIRGIIHKKTSGRIDYVSCVDAQTLAPQQIIKGKTLIALAVHIGRARLIDNIIVVS